MGKRANGEGTIYRKKDGTWCSALVYEDATSGARRRAYLYGKTQREVAQKLKAAAKRAEEGAPVRDAKATLASWLQRWTKTALEASDRKPTTKELYANLCRKHLESAPIGAKPLDRLRKTDVDALILELRAKEIVTSKKLKTTRKLSSSTIRQVYTVLRLALDDAIREGLIARNPAAAVKRPPASRAEARFLSPEEVARILAAAESSRCHAVLSLIAAMGLRKGEALALTWADVDLVGGTLRVHGTLSRVGKVLIVTEPKTEKSRRTLALTPAVVKLLKAHRKTQNAERLHAGSVWVASGHVFTSETGGPLEPRNVLRALTTAAKAASITGANVHTLRHSAATTWLERGVNLKAVSELLGHADTRITGDVYAHVSPETARDAMLVLSDAIGL